MVVGASFQISKTFDDVIGGGPIEHSGVLLRRVNSRCGDPRSAAFTAAGVVRTLDRGPQVDSLKQIRKILLDLIAVLQAKRPVEFVLVLVGRLCGRFFNVFNSVVPNLPEVILEAGLFRRIVGVDRRQFEGRTLAFV